MSQIEIVSNSFTLSVHEVLNSENIHVLTVKWYFTIKDIKDQLFRCTNIPVRYQQLFHDAFPTALRNQMNLHDLGISSSGHILRLSGHKLEKENFVLVEASSDIVDNKCSSLLNDVRLGLRRPGLKPLKTDEFDGTGGVYFMRSATGTNIAVFKPADEEQGMPYNAKNHYGSGDEGLRPHFKPGQGCIREVAAYLLDVDNFHGVPPTTLVRCEHTTFNYNNQRTRRKVDPYPKVGSLQQFIWASDTYEDVGSSLLGDLEVQKIALLDLRILNNDRNEANILAILKRNPNSGRGSRSCSITSYDSTSGESNVDCDENSIEFEGESSHSQKDRYKLVPIDHGYCLPTSLCISQWDWAWYSKPQTKRPVHPALKEYILKIDIEDCIRKLQLHVAAQANVLIPEESLFLVRVMHKLLVDSIQRGLTLYDIARLVARTDEDVPSSLERLISEAEDNAHRYLESHSSNLFKKPISIAATADTKLPPKSDSNFKLDSKSERQEMLMVVPKFKRMTSLFDVQGLPLAESIALRMSTSVSPKCGNVSPKLSAKQSRSSKLFENLTDETSESSSSRESDNLDEEDAVTPHSLVKLNLSPQTSLGNKTNLLVKQFDFSMQYPSACNSAKSTKTAKTVEQNRRISEDKNHTDYVQPKDLLFEFETSSPGLTNNKNQLHIIPPCATTPPLVVHMTRSTSFQGFNSAPIYETNKERRLSKTVPEKRKQAAVTKEFRDLRYSFTKKALKSLISKTLKSKQEKI